MNPIRHFLLALQFFTRIPLPGRVAAWVGFDKDMQRASLAYFPLVGWLVGGVAAVAFVVVEALLPAVSGAGWAAALLSTALTVMLTGAFHEDGLADTADGLGGAVSRERALEIMKDSRIGSYGASALVLALLLKTAFIGVLAQVDVALVAVTLFAAHVCSRMMPIFIVALLPNVGGRADSKSAATASEAGGTILAVAIFWTVLVLVIAYRWHAGMFWLGGVAASGLAWFIMFGLLRRRLQGFTGDTLGATQQVCELAFYFGVLVSLHFGGAA